MRESCVAGTGTGGALSASTSTAPVAVGVEVIVVRCESGAMVTRVKRPVSGNGADGGAVTEHPCNRCRDNLLRSGPYHKLQRRDVLVLHYVDPTQARVIETRAILHPEPGSRELNHGGRQVPREVLQRALGDG